MNTKELDEKYIAHTYSRFPVEIVSGEGAILYGDDGKKYIDLGAGIAVNTFGAADKAWQIAVATQAKKIQHTSNLYYTSPCATLAGMLCERTGMKRVFFSNSGAEANECAIKAARKYSVSKWGDGHSTIITLKNGFHGRTVTTLSATGQEVFHTDFGPFTQGFVYADPSDVSSLEKLASENDCCAVMFEVIQGEGGVNVLTREFVDEIVRVSEKYGLLMIVDEVQTGNGRTGKLYGYMNYDITPDIVTTAKGLGGGLPIGATMLGDRVADVYTPGSHGSTFGGNPICCAGAISILSRIDDSLLTDVLLKSDFIFSSLIGADGVISVSGMGLMIGIEPTRPVRDVVMDCIQNGLLVLSAKNKIRLLPPLNIAKNQLSEAIKILKEVLAK